MFDIELARYGDNIALIENNKHLTYCELQEEIDTFISSLPKQKLLVAFEIEPSIKDIVAYLGFLQRGDVVLAVDASLKEELKEAIYKEYSPNFLFEGSTLKKLHTQKKELNASLALLLPTSGSTGSRKYVRLSKENLYANTEAICAFLPLRSSDVTITTLPLHYTYGLSLLHTHLEVGGSIVLSRNSIISKEFWQDVQNHKVTNLNGVPMHYEMLHRLHFVQKDYEHMRFLTQSGGKLPQKYAEVFATWAKEHNKELYLMYGLTEATARVCYLPPKYTLEKPTSVGVVVKGGKLSITNTNKPFVEGELVFEGKSVMLGYATNSKDLAKGDELNGKLHTGDIGYFDTEGFVYITARAKRFVKISGERISLDEIEQFLLQIQKDVVVLGRDDAITICTTKQNKESLVQLVAKQFKIYHKMLTLEVVKTIIRKPNGKTDYQAMQEVLENG